MPSTSPGNPMAAHATMPGRGIPVGHRVVNWLFPDEGVAHVARRAGASVAG